MELPNEGATRGGGPQEFQRVLLSVGFPQTPVQMPVLEGVKPSVYSPSSFSERIKQDLTYENILKVSLFHFCKKLFKTCSSFHSSYLSNQ